MLADLQDVLTNPGSFFEREAEEPSVRAPVVIVGTVALLGTVSGVVTTQLLAGVFPEQARAFLFVVQLFVAVVGLVAPFVVWLLYAAAFFGISALLGGQGSFRQVALLSAWGFVPRVIGSLVESVAALVAASQLRPGELTSPADYQAFSDALAAHPANLAASVVGIGLLLWSASIWVAAVAEARRLDRREATVVVAVPVGIALLIRLSGLFGAV